MPSNGKEMITLALDVGGTGVKGCLLNEAGRPITARERFETPAPATPEAVIEVLDTLARNLGAFDRASVGFPGVVKKGATLTAHNLDPKWIGFDLQRVLARRWRKPVRVANDAAVQGLAAVEGKGVELVITLGTGFGSSLFIDGKLVPGLELAHHPWLKSKTLRGIFREKGPEEIGAKALEQASGKGDRAVGILVQLYDHLYIGGGNATKIDFELPRGATRVPNEDGLLGGAALWRF